MKKLYFILFLILLANPAWATNYFVKDDGDDAKDGLSDANAWKTIAKVNGFSFSAGDDVYFKCDDTWTTGSLSIDWVGTSGNRVVVGAYYMDPAETIGISGNKPRIDGGGTQPGGEWAPLVEILTSYVTLNGFEIDESTGHGLEVENGSNIIVQNCEIHESYHQNVVVYNSADSAIIQDCDIHHGGRKRIVMGEGDRPLSPNVTLKNCTDAVIRRCTIRDSYWEGINLDDKTDGATIEYCAIYGNYRVQVYVVCARNSTIRHNLIYGTTGNRGFAGIAFNQENWCYHASYLSDSNTYGNLIANSDKSLIIWGTAAQPVRDVCVYNNTFVEADKTGIQVDSGGSGHIFKNNIIFQSSGTVASVASGVATFDYNLWSQDPLDSDAKGANDLTYASPVLEKTSNWTSLASGDLDGTEFALQGTSTAIDAGDTLPSAYENAIRKTGTDYTADPITVVILKQGDYSSWEIGGFIYDAGGTGGNSCPVGTIDLPASNVTKTVGQTLDFEGSYTDADGDTCTYSWDMDGAASPDPNTNSSFTATLNTIGTFTPTLTVNDGTCDDESPPSVIITVNAASDYSDITFWCAFLDDTSDPFTLDSTLEYVAGNGDNTGDLDTEADVNADAKKIGDYGLDCPGASDTVDFVLSSNDLLNVPEGRVGFWWYCTTAVATAQLFRVELDEDNYFHIKQHDTGDGDLGLEWNWKQGAAWQGTLQVPDTGMSTGNWYFIECAWDTVGDTKKLYVNGVQQGSTETTNIVTFAAILMRIGNGTGQATDQFIDNVMISNDATRDFYGGGTGLCDDTAYPGNPPPQVTNIGCLTADGEYGDTDSIGTFPVTFSEIVVVDTGGGTPYLPLETGTNDVNVSYVSGSPGAILTFAAFAVDAAQLHTTLDLDVHATAAIVLNGGTIKAQDDSQDAILICPTGSDAGALANNKAIVIDTAVATVHADGVDNYHDPNCLTCTADGTYATVGTVITTYIKWSEVIDLVYGAPGFPRIEYELGDFDTYAPYLTGLGFDDLLFAFTLTAGMRTTDLTYKANNSLEAGDGGVIQDGSGNDATLTLAEPTAAGSLYANADIVIAVPKAWTLGTGGDYATFTAFDTSTYSVSDDSFSMLDDITDDMTADLVGTSGHPIILDGNYYTLAGTFTNAKAYWTMRETVFDGNATFSGGNQIIERCMFLP
jgi:hypothetical protein